VAASLPEAGARRWLVVVPNALSLLRLLLGVAFPWLPSGWRLPAVLLAALTDMADGASSRLLHASTRLGRLLDPVADKVFVLSVLGVLLWEATLTPVDVLLLGMRDLVVLAGGAWVVARGSPAAWRRLRPTLLGKAATAAQFLFLLSVLFWRQRLLVWLVPAACLSGLAALDYVRLCLAARPRSGNSSEPEACSRR
jgi:phosphatidylglycerophosphate synthase